jgi:hypothetical protein
MHNINEGTLLKRLRIRYFGLTAKERQENASAAREIRASAIRENMEEDRLFDAFCEIYPELLKEDWRVWMPRFWEYAEKHWSADVPRPRWRVELRA